MQRMIWKIFFIPALYQLCGSSYGAQGNEKAISVQHGPQETSSTIPQGLKNKEQRIKNAQELMMDIIRTNNEDDVKKYFSTLKNYLIYDELNKTSDTYAAFTTLNLPDYGVFDQSFDKAYPRIDSTQETKDLRNLILKNLTLPNKYRTDLGKFSKMIFSDLPGTGNQTPKLSLPSRNFRKVIYNQSGGYDKDVPLNILGTVYLEGNPLVLPQNSSTIDTSTPNNSPGKPTNWSIPIGYNIHIPEGNVEAVLVNVYGGDENTKRKERMSKPGSIGRLEHYLLGQGIAIVTLNSFDLLELQTTQLEMGREFHDKLHASINAFFEAIKSPEKLHKNLKILANKPIYLYGSSFGGRTSIRHSELYPNTFDGYISHEGTLAFGMGVKSDTEMVSNTRGTSDAAMKARKWLSPMTEEPNQPEQKITKIQKPILLLHNIDDNNVNVKDPLFWYDKAKQAGKGDLVRLVINKEGNPIPDEKGDIHNKGHYGKEGFAEPIRNFILNGPDLLPSISEWSTHRNEIFANKNYKSATVEERFISIAMRFHQYQTDQQYKELVSENNRKKEAKEPVQDITKGAHHKSWDIFKGLNITDESLYNAIQYSQSNKIDKIKSSITQLETEKKLTDAVLLNGLKVHVPLFADYLKEQYKNYPLSSDEIQRALLESIPVREQYKSWLLTQADNKGVGLSDNFYKYLAECFFIGNPALTPSPAEDETLKTEKTEAFKKLEQAKQTTKKNIQKIWQEAASHYQAIPDRSKKILEDEFARNLEKNLENKNFDEAKKLLQQGVNAKKVQISIVVNAIKDSNDSDLIRLLLKEWSGATLLQFTLENKNFEDTKVLLEHGTDATGVVIHSKNSYDRFDDTRSPIWFYYENQMGSNKPVDLTLIKLLLEKGADADARKSVFSNDTLLNEALEKNLFDLATLLLQHGADVKKVKKDTLLNVVKHAKNSSLIQLLLKGGGESLLQSALEKKNFNDVKVLLEHGVGTDISLLWKTFIMEPNNLNPIKELLEKKDVDVNAMYMGKTLLLTVMESEQYELATLLVDYGAELKHPDGIPLLIFALQKKFQEKQFNFIKHLLEKKKENPNVIWENKNHSYSPLSVIFENYLDKETMSQEGIKEGISLLNLLLDYGAMPEEKVLQWACRPATVNSLGIEPAELLLKQVKLFLEKHGANPPEWILEWACEPDTIKILGIGPAKLLLEHGANPNILMDKYDWEKTYENRILKLAKSNKELQDLLLDAIMQNAETTSYEKASAFITVLIADLPQIKFSRSFQIESNESKLGGFLEEKLKNSKNYLNKNWKDQLKQAKADLTTFITGKKTVKKRVKK